MLLGAQGGERVTAEEWATLIERFKEFVVEETGSPFPQDVNDQLWGAIGAVVGAIAGLFFLPLGLILGPLIGAGGFELAFGNQDARKAAVSGVGSAVGALSAVLAKVLIGVLMIVWFLVDVFFIGN